MADAAEANPRPSSPGEDDVSDRNPWKAQALVLLAIALLGTLPFWLSDLDLRVAALFHHAGADDPWPEGGLPLWSFLYRASPLLMGLVMIGALMALGGGTIWTRWRPLRLPAVLVLASALLGPGLVINGILKDSWGRPRPHQVEALGGTKAYLPPLLLGESGGGKSFPCGHSSVGYMLGVFYLLWRRRRPGLARGALAGAIALGTLFGVGRMAAGDHFLSDVIWSGVIAYGVALALHQGILRIPRRGALGSIPKPAGPLLVRRRVLLGLGFTVASSVVLTGVLLATPVSDNARLVVRVGDHSPDPRVLRIEADHTNLILYRMGGGERALVRLQARGFGLPNARVERVTEVRDGVLTLRIAHHGVFTERDTKLVVGLSANQWDRVEARVGSGDILAHPLGTSGPALDLVSAEGALVIE